MSRLPLHKDRSRLSHGESGQMPVITLFNVTKVQNRVGERPICWISVGYPSGALKGGKCSGDHGALANGLKECSLASTARSLFIKTINFVHQWQLRISSAYQNSR
jgi:hypothetical protein